MDAQQALEVVKSSVDAAGSQKKFADQHGLSQGFVNDVLFGRRELSKAVLDAIGLEKVVTYRRKPKAPTNG